MNGIKEEDRILNIKMAETIDEALKFAKSLVYWLEFIKSNPYKSNDPIGSFGGHIESHLAVLNAWFAKVKIEVAMRNLNESMEGAK